MLDYLSIGSFDPDTVTLLRRAFKEATEALETGADTKVRRSELARCIIGLAMEGERNPTRLRDEALARLKRAIAWRQVG